MSLPGCSNPLIPTHRRTHGQASAASCDCFFPSHVHIHSGRAKDGQEGPVTFLIPAHSILVYPAQML